MTFLVEAVTNRRVFVADSDRNAIRHGSFIVLRALVTGQPRRSIIAHGNWPVSFTRQSISDLRRPCARGRSISSLAV